MLEYFGRGQRVVGRCCWPEWGGLVGKTDFTEEPLCGGKGVKTTASALWLQREGSRRGGREDGPEEVEEG